MTVADSFVCTVAIRFDPWGYAGDESLEVLLPLPSDDGYQRILNLDAPKGQEFMDAHGHRRLIRLENGQVATVTARIETQRLAQGSYLDLPPPGSADLDEGPMTVSDPALRDLARRSLAGICVGPGYGGCAALPVSARRARRPDLASARLGRLR